MAPAAAVRAVALAAAAAMVVMVDVAAAAATADVPVAMDQLQAIPLHDMGNILQVPSNNGKSTKIIG